MHIILNRKDKYNALNNELTDELIDALRESDKSELIKCIVISGVDDFSAGADINELATNPDFITSWELIDSIKKPLIAAVDGIAFGGGNELLLMCDIILASKEAKFSQPEINLGLICGGGGTQRLTTKIGKNWAMEMCLTGNIVSAEEAKNIGLVNHIYDASKLGHHDSKSLIDFWPCASFFNGEQRLELRHGIRRGSERQGVHHHRGQPGPRPSLRQNARREGRHGGSGVPQRGEGLGRAGRASGRATVGTAAIHAARCLKHGFRQRLCRRLYRRLLLSNV